MSSSLDQDQARGSVGPDLGQTVYIGYQQGKVAASRDFVLIWKRQIC